MPNLTGLLAGLAGLPEGFNRQQEQQQEQLYRQFLMQQQQQQAAQQAQQMQQQQQALGAAWGAAGQLGGGGMGGQPQPPQQQPLPQAPGAMAGRLPQAAPGVNLQGENPDFRTRLASLGGAMPPDVYDASKITSGYRSPEEQAQLYARYKAGQGGLAAPPGQSMHNKGLAADWSFSNPQADQWTHQNAGQFGLGFPLGGKDPNHMQMIVGEAKQVSTAVTQAVPQQQWGRSSVSDLARAVEQANPDATPQVKMLALLQLQKLMAPDEKMQLQMMLQQNRGVIQEEIAKLRTDTQRDIAGARESGLDSRLRTLEAGRDQRLQETEAGRDQRFEKGEAGRNARAQARNDIQTIKAQRQTAGTNPATRRLALQSLLTDIDAKIRATDDDAAKAEYQAEREDIVKEMKGLAGLKKSNPTPKVPAPETSPLNPFAPPGGQGAGSALPPQ